MPDPGPRVESLNMVSAKKETLAGISQETQNYATLDYVTENKLGNYSPKLLNMPMGLDNEFWICYSVHRTVLSRCFRRRVFHQWFCYSVYRVVLSRCFHSLAFPQWIWC